MDQVVFAEPSNKDRNTPAEPKNLPSRIALQDSSQQKCRLMRMATIDTLERPAALLRGRRLEYFTIAWNTFEGLVALVTGIIAGSISLMGFGIDSFIEVTSGSVLLWRMSVDSDANRRERNEKWALRIVGACFLLLAAYVVYDSILDLWSKRAPEHSIEGIVLACVSLVVMPVLSRAKRNVGRALGSAAMHADAKQTEFCIALIYPASY
jgi:divalent metal cation (Fe/Co/Zn/Cd) transporter